MSVRGGMVDTSDFGSFKWYTVTLKRFMDHISRSEHVTEDVKRYKSVTFSCGVCSNTFVLSGRKLHDAIHNRKRCKSGPFCSKSCAGKASHTSENYENSIIKVEYTTLKHQRSLIEEI